MPIVGIGASAGGLEALSLFLSHAPDDSGMAFVVIQHLDPTHMGILSELLQRATSMKVTQVYDQLAVEPNCVYVIPPGKSMSVQRGVLHLLEPMAPRGLRLPIDSFLQSLAEDQQQHAVAVILSGMGSDGTVGIRAIKENAGLVLVQTPETAKFDGMPRSAIDSGLTDIVAPVEELAGRIIAFRDLGVDMAEPDAEVDDKSSTNLEKIIALLRTHSGHDFTQYKKSTLYRRIERRMGIHQIHGISQYVTFLQDNPAEVGLLFKELLIGVTSFFRDPDEWANLTDMIICPRLSDGQSSHELRAWVAGCSTGEEAYTLAMVFKEAVDQTTPSGRCTLKIFATDLDKDAIERARQGLYPQSIAADVSPERISRFFTEDQGQYRVNAEIREMVIFAPQNVVKDPPFTRMNIVTCRNLLIYMEQDLQRLVLRLFHYSLLPEGALLLGSAETTSGTPDLFRQMEGKTRLYRRLSPVVPPDLLDFPRNVFPTQAGQPPAVGARLSTGNIQMLADQLLLRSYTPASVLVNGQGDVLYICGHTGKFLEPAAGKANWNIFAMAKDDIRYELASAFQKVIKQKTTISIKDLKLKTDTENHRLDISLQWIQEPVGLRGMVMIVFHEMLAVQTSNTGQQNLKPTRSHSKTALLETELLHTREELQGVQEQMQASNEELRSANEELQSTNEEIQSTNEELTTSREEMQSLNEELQTVNTELQAKVDELSRSSDDMKNLLDSTDIATVFLDNKLLVRRFTYQATKIMRLIPSDVGRPVTDITSDLLYDGLTDDAQDVLRTLVFSLKQIPTRDGRWYSVRIMPYRTVDNRIDGVVITLSDISAAKALETELRLKADRINNILNCTSDSYVSLDNQLRVSYLNTIAEQLLHRNSDASIGISIYDLCPMIKGSVFDEMFAKALNSKEQVSFNPKIQIEPFAECKIVRIYPEVDGLSVFFQANIAIDTEEIS
ncbi:MAG: chemotaxis protein CheB [Armatimonadota bacterium]